VLKAHRLKNTAAFGSKQNIYLRLVAGSEVRTSDVVPGVHAFGTPKHQAAAAVAAAAAVHARI
jgi:hypothetical protein